MSAMDPDRPSPIVLVILDGWGVAPPGPGNALSQANLPNFNNYFTAYPHATLTASGEQVGLPRGEVGNTETGHMNLGAGQIVYQDLPRINMAIADGTFFYSEALISAAKHTKKYGSQLHIMGLVGAGGVHSKLEHLISLIRFCVENKLENVAVHAFTDGRDSPPTSAQIYLDKIQADLERTGVGYIASVTGRYYAMDRDFRWDRTEKAYDALTKGKGKTGTDYKEIINNSYKEGKTDEFIEPSLITTKNGDPKALVKADDAVIFYNFRIDRPRQLTKAFVLPEFNDETVQGGFNPYDVKYYGKHDPDIKPPVPTFNRGPKINNLLFVSMTEYEKNLPVDDIVIPPLVVSMPMGRVISNRGWRQLRAAESEKERFVTFYFNGQRESAFPSEERLIIPSPKVPTYDEKPEMSALQLTDAVVQKLSVSDFDLVVMNYANADMVGHTGNLQAAIKAVETVDKCLGKLVPFVLAKGGVCLITADHGNAETMLNPQSGQPDTEHSGTQVPFIVISNKRLNRLNLGSGILADVAPTILGLVGLKKPSTMSGKDLLAGLQ